MTGSGIKTNTIRIIILYPILKDDQQGRIIPQAAPFSYSMGCARVDNENPCGQPTAVGAVQPQGEEGAVCLPSKAVNFHIGQTAE
jgi:hypothetical protein